MNVYYYFSLIFSYFICKFVVLHEINCYNFLLIIIITFLRLAINLFNWADKINDIKFYSLYIFFIK